MSNVTCPRCGYRSSALVDETVCLNCGELLATKMVLPPVPSAAPSAAPSSVSSTVDSSAGLMTYKAQDKIGGTFPVNNTPLDTMKKEEKSGVFWRSTRLKGIVIHVQMQEDDRHNSELFGSILKVVPTMIGDFVSPMSHQYGSGNSSERNKKVVHLVRLRAEDSMRQYDVRLEGKIKRGNIALGDLLALKGRYSKGTFMVHRAYNETSQAHISRGNSAAEKFWLVMMGAVALVVLYVLIANLPLFHL